MIIINLSTVLVFGLLTISLLSQWLPISEKKPIWMLGLLLSLLLGMYFDIVSLLGVLFLIGLVFLCEANQHRNIHSHFQIVIRVLIVIAVAALFLHSIPFFNNPMVFDQYFFSDKSAGYTKYWNLDKAAAGVILLGYFGDICRTRSAWAFAIQKSYVISIVTIVASIFLAFFLDYIRLDITFTYIFFLWAWANLFFTCVAEEMLFRGFLQKYFLRLTNIATYQIGIVVLVGLLFGAAHFAGGMVYVIVASVAGIGYGLAYYKSGRIEMAIFTHFLLNALHFLFFTYPVLLG